MWKILFVVVALMESVAGTSFAKDSAAPPTQSTEDPLAYRQPFSDESWILRDIRVQHRFHQSIVAAFDTNSTGCSEETAHFASLEIHLEQHGVDVAFYANDVKLKVYSMIATDGNGWVGVVDFASCAIQIDLRKFILDGGRWHEVKPTMPAMIHDWNENETSLGWPANLLSADLLFTFLAHDDDECPKIPASVPCASIPFRPT